MLHKKLSHSKTFRKNFKIRIKPYSKLQEQFNKRLHLFVYDRYNTTLNDHKLSGSLSGYRAFSISGDLRVVYIESEDEFLFVDIGTHNQVY